MDANVLHQLCLAHGIHLAVCDTLCKKSLTEKANIEFEDDSSDEEFDFEDDATVIYLQPFVGECIKKVRAIVVFFHRSPLSNDKLQFFVRAGNGSDLKLINDCRTRWNSLLSMLERYVQLHSFVRQALIALSKESLSLLDKECETIRNVCLALQPIKAGIDRMNRRGCDLIIANRVLDFVDMKLREAAEQSSIASHLHHQWISRITDRSTIMAQVLKFLDSGNLDSLSLRKISSFIFELLTRTKFSLEVTTCHTTCLGRSQ